MTKNLKTAKSKVDQEKVYKLEDAIKLAKKISFEKFDTSLNISFNLNLDTKQADQQLRGPIVLPNGTGKVSKVVAIVDDADIEKAKKAGADVVGDEILLQSIVKEGKFDFDYIVTTPSNMPFFAKHGKALGTKGLMPNPKLGTVTNKIEKAIKDIKKGQLEYRTDADANINILFGKKSFDDKALAENAQAIIDKIKSLRPSSVKGTYIKNISISTTMGPGIKIVI